MRMLVILIFISLLNVIAIGQETSAKSLKLFIKSNKKQVCLGETSIITAKITNFSEKPIVIDTKRIGYSVDFFWFNDVTDGASGGSFNSIGDVGFNYQPNFIILQPKESHFENLKVAFDNEKFSKAQKYSMQTAYGQFSRTKFKNIDIWRGAVESNEIDIVINNCEIK
jgi:hypothetical protein